MHDPALARARAGVLHYFAQRNRAVPPGRLIFRFHDSDQARAPRRARARAGGLAADSHEAAPEGNGGGGGGVRPGLFARGP